MSRDGILPGTLIAERYKVLEEIGIGGMGTVYRVHDTLLGDKEIALKTLLEEFARQKAYVERFVREIELMNRINHTNVVRTYDIGTDGDLIYFTMEFVQGISLEMLLDKGPLPLKDIPRLIVQLCKGLDAIHSADIIHRDLKPGNVILLADGNFKITDFGVARPKVSHLTRKNERVGSIWYMAPETWQGVKLSRQTDLYSLGVMLFESITGRLPFDSDEAARLMQMHLKQAPPSPRKYREDVPAWIEALNMKLLEKSPSARPKSAKEIIKIVRKHAANNASKKISSETRSRRRPEQSIKEAVQPRSANEFRNKKRRYKGKKLTRSNSSYLPWEPSPVTTLLLFLIVVILAFAFFLQLVQ